MNDFKGRKIVLSNGFCVVGAVGIIVRGLKMVMLTQTEMPLLLEEWERINFQLSPDLVQLILTTKYNNKR